MGERAKTLDQILAGHSEARRGHGRQVKALVRELTQEAIEVGILSADSHYTDELGTSGHVLPVLLVTPTDYDYQGRTVIKRFFALTPEGKIKPVEIHTSYEGRRYRSGVNFGKELTDEEYLDKGQSFVRELQTLIIAKREAVTSS